jgi:hypothetical protein
MQRACAKFSCAVCLAVSCLSTLSHKRHKFRKTVTEQKMCALNLSTTFVSNIFHSKKNWETYDQKIYIYLHVKYTLFLSEFNWIVSNEIKIMYKYQISWKSFQWQPNSSMRTDGRTERRCEANSWIEFRNSMSATHKTNLVGLKDLHGEK